MITRLSNRFRGAGLLDLPPMPGAGLTSARSRAAGMAAPLYGLEGIGPHSQVLCILSEGPDDG